MRLIFTLIVGLGLVLPLAPAHAIEKGAMLRAGELKAKPFLDAATADKLAANQPVSIVSRQGGWAQVEANGKTGWVRILSLRLEAGAARPGRASQSASLLRTGSSGKTVTTGIKGMDEEDIRNATPNYAELELMGRLGVPADQASANAKQSGLSEYQIAYLKERSK